MNDLGLSMAEMLSADPQTDSVEFKKLLLRIALRESKFNKRMCINRTAYTPLLVHFDTLLRELRIEDSKPILERLNAFEKVYKDEIYTFLIEHFHKLNENEIMWKIMVILEQCGSGRG